MLYAITPLPAVSAAAYYAMIHLRFRYYFIDVAITLRATDYLFRYRHAASMLMLLTISVTLPLRCRHLFRC